MKFLCTDTPEARRRYLFWEADPIRKDYRPFWICSAPVALFKGQTNQEEQNSKKRISY